MNIATNEQPYTPPRKHSNLKKVLLLQKDFSGHPVAVYQ